MNRLSIFLLLLLAGSCRQESVEVPKLAGRKVSLAITKAANETWDDAYSLAVRQGINYISIDLDWNQLEPDLNVYELGILEAVDKLFPSDNLPVFMKIHPVNQTHKAFPDDLKNVSFDAPQVIDRFNALLDTIHARTTHAAIHKICIGNEIDTYLANDSLRWQSYAQFYTQTATHAKQLWGQRMPVSSVLTYFSIENPTPAVERFTNLTDFLALTYYPLQTDFTVKPIGAIASDFAVAIRFAGGKKIVFTECGCPSGDACKSSEKLQSEFVKTVFTNWDTHAAAIEGIVFTWLTDYSEAAIDQMISGLGYSHLPNQDQFKAYLQTLGYRTTSGKSKEAFTTLIEEVRRRK